MLFNWRKSAAISHHKCKHPWQMFGGSSERKTASILMVTAIVIKNSPIQGAQRELPWQAPFISSYCFIIIKALDLLTLKKTKFVI